MSFQAMAEAVKAPLAGNDKLIFILMANYADHKNICWPSQATLAEEAGLSGRSVRNITARMEKLGYLLVLRRGSGSKPSKYQLVFNPVLREKNGQESDSTPENISSPKDVLGAENSSSPVRKIFPSSPENISSDPISDPITKDLSLNASANETLPAVQNALVTGRVTPMSSSLPSAFMMSLFWEPGADFEKYARMLGLTNPTYTEAQLNEFRIYWEPTGRCFHHTQWIQKFVQRLKSESNRGLTNDQRNADVRAGFRPAANGGSAYQRGLAAMEQVSSACGNNDFWGNYAARLSGELGISPVRDPLANDANPIDDTRGSGRVFDGDCQNLSDSEGGA